MDRGVWQDTVHGVKKSRTQLSNMHAQIHTPTHIHTNNGLKITKQKIAYFGKNKTIFQLAQP